MPANHRQAEDRAYRLGQTERVTVEYMLADGTLDGFIAELLEAKLRLIGAVEGDVPPDTSVLDDLYAKLRSLGPALLLENQAGAGYWRGARAARSACKGEHRIRFGGRETIARRRRARVPLQP